MRTIKLIIVLVPLAVLLVIGVASALLCGFFGWLDDQCKERFENIWGKNA